VNIFQIITTFGNLIGQIEGIVATGQPVTPDQVAAILTTILKDIGILIPKDAPLFDAIGVTIGTLPNVFAEAKKLGTP
jgi:hypothetical protein